MKSLFQLAFLHPSVSGYVLKEWPVGSFLNEKRKFISVVPHCQLQIYSSGEPGVTGEKPLVKFTAPFTR